MGRALIREGAVMVVAHVSDRRAGDRRDSWQRGWFIGAGLAALALLALVVLPHGTWAWDAAYVVASATALLVYVRQGLRIPPPAGRFWRWLLAFIVLTLVADVVNEFVPSSSTGAFPDPVDWVYVIAYVPALVALALLIRRRYPGRDHEAWIDALILGRCPWHCPVCQPVVTAIPALPRIGPRRPEFP